MKILAGLILILAVSGCATLQSSNEHLAGKPITVAILQYGKPKAIFSANGNSYYSWEVEHKYKLGWFHSVCNMTLEVNKNNIIIGIGVVKTSGIELMDSCD